jgi:hypothetical protein
MALAYSTRRATRDLDAVFEPKQVIYEIARRVADRHGLPVVCAVPAHSLAEPPRSTTRIPEGWQSPSLAAAPSAWLGRLRA